jgi:hypothetical protein
MSTSYEADVVAWANEQAALLREGKFSQLDIEHIADEVEDVGKSEKRELKSHMATLLAHLRKFTKRWMKHQASDPVSPIPTGWKLSGEKPSTRPTPRPVSRICPPYVPGPSIRSWGLIFSPIEGSRLG